MELEGLVMAGKLVRDKIPDRIAEEQDVEPVTAVVPKSELLWFLKARLVQSVGKLQDTVHYPGYQKELIEREAADVLEAVGALVAERLGRPRIEVLGDILSALAGRYDELGGYERGVFLVGVKVNGNGGGGCDLD